MLKIEVWKCRPAWLALPLKERDLFINRFSAVVRRNLSPEASPEGGPYLIYPHGGCILLWTWEPRPDGEVVQARKQLDVFFELLLDIGPNSNLTAKSLAGKLKT